MYRKAIICLRKKKPTHYQQLYYISPPSEGTRHPEGRMECGGFTFQRSAI